MPFCTECGERLGPRNKFCGGCGHPADAAGGTGPDDQIIDAGAGDIGGGTGDNGGRPPGDRGDNGGRPPPPG